MRTTSVCLLGLAALLATARGVEAQGTITGTVRDAATSAPLARVTVSVLGTGLGAETDDSGRYALSGVPPGTYRLRARRLGHTPGDTTVVVQDGQQTVMGFQLKASAIELKAVEVAVGYGTQRKRDLTGSQSSVSGNDFATSPVARPDQALAGRAPGVQVQTTNAQPGAEMRIRVRGGNSLRGSNEPLVVVDGVIGGDLDQISTSDVESIEVLKDASATAIYGARGANGVILVTTKRGQPGQIRFGYSGYIGMQDVTKHIDLLGADEFARLFMRNPTHDKSVIFDTLSVLPSTDWQDLVYRTASIQSHEVRVSGSTGGTSLMVSAGVFDQQGVVRSSGLTRGSLRINLDQGFGERFRLGTRISYSRSVGNEVRVNDGYGSDGGPVTMMALRFAPTIPPRDAAGNFSGPLLAGQAMDNPLAIIQLRDDKNTTDYLIGNAFGEYDLVPGLTLRTSLGYTTRDFLNQRYTSRLLRAALNRGQANIDNSTRTTWLSENTVTFRRILAERHELTLLGGFTAQETRRTANNAQGRGFTSDLLGYRRLNLADEVTGGSSQSRERQLAFLGRINYGFAGKYLVTATFRADGSSKFPVNNKWAYFPSAAVAWRVSDEPFMRRLAPAVSELKVRASAGQTGSEAISAYQSLAAWSVGSIYAVGATVFRNGAQRSRIANPNLRWETTTQYDAGLDLGLFDNRVTLTADAYHKTTRDLLYEKQVPYIVGFEDYPTNIGKVLNRGLELGLDTRHTVGAFEVRVGGNLSFNRSKVLDLGGDKEFTLDGVNGSLPRFRPAAIVRVGEPLGNFYGWVWDGIFQSQAEVTASGQAGARVGGMKLKDLNGDGKIDSNDRTILGNAQPRYLFGQTGAVSYKGLSLSYLVRGVLDFKVVNLNRQGMETPGGDVNMLRSVLNYWTPSNPTNTMTGLGVGPYDGMTSRWVEDGSFIRLQNVTVGWDVPPWLSGRFGMGQLRVYLSGQNLLTLTRYSWYDPEVSSRGTSDLDLGWDDSSYPGTKTITVGMNVGF
jgi:TonB-linked SusC/RagA family outer membrane protein